MIAGHRTTALATAAALLIGSIAVRVPFATTHLYAPDSTLYARALEQGFYVTADPATERPHPPGYIWYVAVAAGVRAVVHDSNAALVIVSVGAGAAAAAALYLIARHVVSHPVALVAGAAFSVAPVPWMYSEVAYPYTVLALLSLLLGWWLIDGRLPIVSSLALGVLAGFRQDLLLVLGPLWLWRMRSLGLPGLANAAGALVAGALTWLLPTMALSGGPVAYLAALGDQGARVGASTPLAADTFTFNAALTVEGLLWGVGPLGAILVADGAWTLYRWARGGPRALRPGRVATGLAIWTLPAIAVYLFGHIGEWGYVLSVVPPLVLASAIRADRAARRLPRRARIPLGALVVILPALIFLFAPIRFSAARLHEREIELSAPGRSVVADERAIARGRETYDG